MRAQWKFTTRNITRLCDNLNKVKGTDLEKKP
jgi:hypothetical protein